MSVFSMINNNLSAWPYGLIIIPSDHDMDFETSSEHLATTPTCGSKAISITECRTASKQFGICSHRVSILSPRFCFLLDLIGTPASVDVAVHCMHREIDQNMHDQVVECNERKGISGSERSSSSSGSRDMILADLRHELHHVQLKPPNRLQWDSTPVFGGYASLSTGRPSAISGR
jgi:hypothetical protein